MTRLFLNLPDIVNNKNDSMPLLDEYVNSDEEKSFIITPNDYYYNPFYNDIDSDNWELIHIKKSDNPIRMYKAEIKNTYTKEIIYVYFGGKYQKIFKDKTKYKLYKKNELLTLKQRAQYYINCESKIKKKYSTHYLVWKFLM